VNKPDPKTVYVLVQAGEGDTVSVVVAYSKSDLITTVKRLSAKLIEGGFQVESDRDALIEMLQAHDNWEDGWYKLSNVEPQWREWTLFISGRVDGDGVVDIY
jgi:hypothetical protein